MYFNLVAYLMGYLMEQMVTTMVFTGPGFGIFESSTWNFTWGPPVASVFFLTRRWPWVAGTQESSLAASGGPFLSSPATVTP